MAKDPADLDFPPEQLRAMGMDVLRRVVDHLAALPDAPAVGDLDAAEFCRTLREPAPEEGTDLGSLLGPLFDDYIPRSYTTPGPGYMAYIPGGGLFTAALADFISDATNRYTGIFAAAPALVQLEANVLDWFRDWMEFPPSTRGLLTPGGSMATFNAIACAREDRLGPEIRPGVLYASTQAHHSVAKAAKLAGIAADRVRAIPVDDHFRMRVDALSDVVAADRRRGLRPFFVASAAGSTNTGAVDPLEALADFCAGEGLWHHIDGAYGAFFHMVPKLRPLLAGLPRADSLTLDPHKGLFLPYGTGALLVRDGAALRRLHGGSAGYLPDAPDADAFYDPSQHGPELSRGFPGLRIWLTIKLYGAARLRAAVAEKRRLAVWAAEQVGAIPGVVMVAPPQLSLFAFHLDWPGSTLAARNAATRAWLDRVAARGRVFLTGCTLPDGRFLARVCILSFRTRRDRVEECVTQLAEEAARVLAGGAP